MGIPDLVRISFKTSGGGVGSRCAPERHATLGCAGATQPGAWQRPGTWGLNEKLNMCSSVLGRGAGGGWQKLHFRHPDSPAYVAQRPRSAHWEKEAGQGLARLLCSWEGPAEGGHRLTLGLEALGWVCGPWNLQRPRQSQGKGTHKSGPTCVQLFLALSPQQR